MKARHFHEPKQFQVAMGLSKLTKRGSLGALYVCPVCGGAHRKGHRFVQCARGYFYEQHSRTIKNFWRESFPRESWLDLLRESYTLPRNSILKAIEQSPLEVLRIWKLWREVMLQAWFNDYTAQGAIQVKRTHPSKPIRAVRGGVGRRARSIVVWLPLSKDDLFYPSCDWETPKTIGTSKILPLKIRLRKRGIWENLACASLTYNARHDSVVIEHTHEPPIASRAPYTIPWLPKGHLEVPIREAKTRS